MLRTTYTNIKRVCTFKFVPRLLRAHVKYSPSKFEKSGVCATKSTVAGSDDIQRQVSNERKEQAKRQRIINYIFGTGEYPASDITGFEGIKIIEDCPTKENKIPDDVLLLSTTRKDYTENHEERLIQKIEKIEEPSLVEAEKPKIDSLNTEVKILGNKLTGQSMNELGTSRHRRNRFSRVLLSNSTMNTTLRSLKRDNLVPRNWQQYNQWPRKPKIVTFYPKGDTLKERLNFSTNDGNRKPGPSPELDLAKSLRQKSNQIDERFLDEMEKLGVPATGPKSHNLNGEIVQADIMGKSKKTVEKPDMDLESRQLEDVDRKRLYKLNVVKPLEPNNRQEYSKSTLIMPNQLSIECDVQSPPETKLKMGQSEIESTKPHANELVGIKMNTSHEQHGTSAGGTPKLSRNIAVTDPNNKITTDQNTYVISSVETSRFVNESQRPLVHDTNLPHSQITIKEVTYSPEEVVRSDDKLNTDELTPMNNRHRENLLYNVQQNVQDSPKTDGKYIRHRTNTDTLHSDTIELEQTTQFKEIIPMKQQKEEPSQSTQEEKLTTDEPGESSPLEILKCEKFIPPTIQLQFKSIDVTKMAPKTFRTDPFNLQMKEPEIYASDTTESQKIRLHTISPDIHQDKEQGNQPQTIEPVKEEPTKVTEDPVEKTKEDLSKFYMPQAHEQVRCNISASVGPLPFFNTKLEENIPLSEMLVRVRMRSRMEICKTIDCTQAEPEARKCPPPPGCRPPPCCPPPCCPPPRCPPPPPCPKPCPPPPPCCPPPQPCPKPCPPPPCPKPCPPPPPRCPPPPCPKPCPPPPPCCPPPPCPPPIPCCPPCPCPRPPPKCEKPKPKCPPCKKPLCPDPCPPKKPDPCRSSSCIGNDIDAYIILSSSYPKVVTPYATPILPRTLIQSRVDNLLDPELVEEGNTDDIVLAREFEPWTPIPCWPYPEKFVKRPHWPVCPKDGCKVQRPPKDGDFCKPPEKPCTHFPKRLTFLAKDMLPEHSGKKKVFDLDHF